MKFWNKIKQFIRHKAEASARAEVLSFLSESLTWSEEFPYFPKSFFLKKRKERMAHKENLTATYTYQSDDDLLSKKQDFIDQYTVNEKEQFDYFVTNNPFVRSNKIKTKAWRDHEQQERLQAQTAWRIVARRNHSFHMRSKFMKQRIR